MKINTVEYDKIKKIMLCVISAIFAISILSFTVKAYSYNVSCSIKYSECSGHQNGIHYSFNKGTISATNCQGKCESDGDPSITREPTVYIELRRRTLGGIGYASFGEKNLGSVRESQGWKTLSNTSWKVDAKDNDYYTIVRMSSSNVQKYFKCKLSQ